MTTQQERRVMSLMSSELDSRLHPYQLRAVEHLRRNPRGALFLDMLP
jgi:hypothetical protein